uniref:DNA repair protein XRCC2-like n=1 Tax=Phallusia mammillata TaxID=59560 RepID=A0A6F9DXQ5_9ASCI|nr:DNA repair protein XRCC2-like [Phallusia mammillata]
MLTSRPKTANLARDLFIDDSSLQNKHPIEITGDTGTGKSAVLHDISIKCILPKKYNGHNVGVIYFDLDYHFELPQFVSTIEQKTKASENEIKNWLKNFYLCRCDTAEQLIVTLHSVEPLIANSSMPIRLLILDSITAFYWIDSHAGGKSQYLRESNMNKIVDILKIFRDKYGLCIISAGQHLMNPERNQEENRQEQSYPQYKQFLCRQWQEFIKHRFVFTQAPAFGSSCFISHKVGPTQSDRHFTIGNTGVAFIS